MSHKSKQGHASPLSLFQSLKLWYAKTFIAGIGIFLLYLFLYLPLKWNIGKHYIRKEGQTTTGTIIERESYVRSSHITGERMYYYRIIVDGTSYEETSGSTHYHIGDTICVRYWPAHPTINVPCYEMD